MKPDQEMLDSRIWMEMKGAKKLHDDLEMAIALLNEVSSHAYYYRSKSKAERKLSLDRIESAARRARNILEEHVWPF